ncbi:MAG: ABC transporter ATP-binding protein [Burkholderiaceae bacterium]|nr:ABC transporter ATP-binding protein [Burkholderiaceae bacterium]
MSTGFRETESAARQPSPLLELDQVEVTYHRIAIAVQGVSLQVLDRQIVALLGSNGAGKTTILRAISGFLGVDDARVSEGTICFDGEAIANRAPHWVTGRGIVLVPERDKVFENLSVEENLDAVVGRRAAAGASMRQAVYEYFPALARLREREAGYLSGGERQMLAIGSALMCAPRLLLVDELSLGLAPIVVEQLAERLCAIRRDLGMSILLVEQNAPVALGIADYAYIVENGRIVLDGDRGRLSGHQDVQDFYLGAGGAGRRSYRDVKQYRRSRRWYG